MFLMHEPLLMGTKQRLYIHEDVVLGIDPGPTMTWGYWGVAIRALDKMWRDWDVVELEFAIVVERDGLIGTGFLSSLRSRQIHVRGRRSGGKKY